jgi:CRP-like cAMP-binding protein
MNECNEHHSCANCPSRLSTEWRDLGADELTIIDRAKRTQKHVPGVALFNQGDDPTGLYCIQSGLIGLRRLDSEGKSVLLRLCSAGTTVGYRAFLSKTPHANSAEVLAPSIVCFIDRSTATDLLKRSPRLGERFLQHALSDLGETEDDYARRQTTSLRTRFLHVMMVFYEQIGYRDEAGYPAFDLPIKKSELAEIIGVQPESISRVIHSVQAQGLMKILDRRIQFRDMDRVLRDAGAEF